MKEKLHSHQLVELLLTIPANAEVSSNSSVSCIDLASLKSNDALLTLIQLLLSVVLLLFHSIGNVS